jgi:hypothetical protein
MGNATALVALDGQRFAFHTNLLSSTGPHFEAGRVFLILMVKIKRLNPANSLEGENWSIAGSVHFPISCARRSVSRAQLRKPFQITLNAQTRPWPCRVYYSATGALDLIAEPL